MISKARHDFIQEQLEMFYKQWAARGRSFSSPSHFSMENIIYIMGVRQSGNTSMLKYLYENLTNAYVLTNNTQTSPVPVVSGIHRNNRVIFAGGQNNHLWGIRHQFIGALLVDYSCPNRYGDFNQVVADTLRMLGETKRGALIDFPIPVIVG